MVHIVVSAIAVLIFIGNANSYTHWYNESIFKFGNVKNYCDMHCGKAKHILCHVKPQPKCSDNFYLFNLDESNLKNDVLLGLNGLRNRIADKMQVANMISLSWDDELTFMAETFLEQCKLYAKNPCTNLGDSKENAAEKEPRYYHIAESYAFRKTNFFPNNFFPSILRDWYYEKNNMKAPEISKSKFNEYYGVLKGHNNFTRLANPILSRVGCGLARFEDGYGLLCYFFPYFQSNVRFDRGPPATSCPNLFPLKGAMFQNTCTNRGINYGPNISKILLLMGILEILKHTYGYRMFRLRVQGGSIFWQKWNW
ncbi:scoloptoxin SSD976-like [Eupeodes corollae]|uniref:scoloptoxin SSD976-like n=1 Tax=Eupeodes corollae TaxID=290404 RepID=UPI00249399C1|nr:scoloptoxin SSD976-like [Eupeodes corollae]